LKWQERNKAKGTLGITKAKSKKKSCRNCFYLNKGKICSKHLLKVKDDNVCAKYNSKEVRVYGGGSVRPK